MKKILRSLFFANVLLHITVLTSAQKINWNSAPRKGFVFEISNKEAQKLLTKSLSDTIFVGLLRNQIDTFDVQTGWINRPSKGHFILARIEGNKLHCEYTSVFPYQVFLLKEYDALAIQVLDLDGNVREDARVKLGYRRVRIDLESKTYRLENEWFIGNERVATVELDGFRSVFNIQKHDVPSWYGNYDDDEGPTFYSYLITDKNKYKPNEKVRFKSYALSHLKSPLRKELEIWLTGSQKDIKLGIVAPHRPGSFAGEFQLHDSLKLILDRHYLIQLREKKGRVVANCTFKYEDYELFGNKLDVQIEKTKQYFPENNRLTITATDVNGLILKDARASVLIKTKAIHETFQPLVILPDTLMFTQIDLDPNNPTSLTIPCELFQKANTTYEVSVSVLNSQNQRMETIGFATYFYSQYELTTHFSNDSICYDILKNGEPMSNVPINLQYNEELSVKEVFLPFKEKLNPATTLVRLNNDFVSKQIFMSNLKPSLELLGGITRDSIKVSLSNPQKIDVSWYVYQGSTLLKKGFGKELEFESLIENRAQTYYVELLYSFGGEERIERRQYDFKEEYLNVSLDIPERIYPGQKVDATIHVLNQLGEPVRDVDLTALAVTSKLGYYPQNLPYYGTSSTPRPKAATYSKRNLDKRIAILKLEYRKWERIARLDTMKYYQFTYPYSKSFTYSYDINDGTQFALYVMQNGVAKQVFVVEVDRQPVYYSWVDNPKEYSFYVSPVGKREVSLRLFDRVVILDSISFEKGRKTIISIDIDHLPKGAKVVKLEKELTSTERNRHINYIASFRNANRCYLESSSAFTPIYSWNNRYKGFVVVGPVFPSKKTYVEPDGLKTTYQHTGGYSYTFEDNIVYKLNASNLLPDKLKDITFNPMANVNDEAITKVSFLEEKTIPKPIWHAKTIDIAYEGIRLRTILPHEVQASGIAALIFEDTKTKSTTAPCVNSNSSRSYFNSIPKGLNNIVLLYNNGTYLKRDSVNIEKYRSIVVDLNHSDLNSADSFSSSLLYKYGWLTSNCYSSSVETIKPSRSYFITYGTYWNVRGTVFSSEDNMPLPGASVIVKGTNSGAASDIDGRFFLSIYQPRVIVEISFIGYKTKEIEVMVGSDITVFLEPETLAIQEIVVVAYGISAKRSMTGSVVTVELDNIKSQDDNEINNESDDLKVIREAEQKLYQELLSLNTIRSNFSDVGFWEPRLYTDKRGESKFTVTFPDDITRWDALVYAMNRHAQTGTVRKSIKSYKPLMAELNVPQFLTRGDSAFFLGKVLNYTTDTNIVGSVKWSGANTDFEKSISFQNYHTDMLPVNAITTDSITTRYVFTRADGFTDGEERTISVVEQGVVRADGVLSILENGDDKHVVASDNEVVSVEILDNQLHIYGQEVGSLLNYRYACNEQLASKLIGLVNHKMLMEYEGKQFRYDKDVNRIIKWLLKNQNQEFLWSWWDVSPSTSYWMSAHILRALKLAKDAGYSVDLNLNNLKSKAEYKYVFLKGYSISDIDLLHSLAGWGVSLNYKTIVNVLDSIIRARDTIYKGSSLSNYRYSFLKEKFLIQEIKQIAGLPYQLDTLLKYKKEGIRGEIYFSDSKPSYYWYDDEMLVNTIAYRIIRRDSTVGNLLAPMQLYFVSSREKGVWNTYQSSNVLMTVLPDLLAAGFKKGVSATVLVRGKNEEKIVKFPYRVELKPKEELYVHKESGLPLYYMQYTKERVVEAKTGIDGFAINTYFGQDSVILEAGKPVDFFVEVEVKKDAFFEHVMIEVPIPGTCSYADKRQPYSRVETHREYFKEQVNIFCEKMEAGKYKFVIRLLPRFTGRYLVNPAQISLMYFPVVNANTSLKHVVVKN